MRLPASAIASTSGSAGVRSSQAANPAKPAPSAPMRSMAAVGTSLARCTPRRSLNETRKYLIPSVRRSSTSCSRAASSLTVARVVAVARVDRNVAGHPLTAGRDDDVGADDDAPRVSARGARVDPRVAARAGFGRAAAGARLTRWSAVAGHHGQAERSGPGQTEQDGQASPPPPRRPSLAVWAHGGRRTHEPATRITDNELVHVRRA